MAGIEQNFGEGGGEVGRGWAGQWACLGRIGQSPKKRDGLKEKLSKKQAKCSKTGAFRGKTSSQKQA